MRSGHVESLAIDQTKLVWKASRRPPAKTILVEMRRAVSARQLCALGFSCHCSWVRSSYLRSYVLGIRGWPRWRAWLVRSFGGLVWILRLNGQQIIVSCACSHEGYCLSLHCIPGHGRVHLGPGFILTMQGQFLGKCFWFWLTVF